MKYSLSALKVLTRQNYIVFNDSVILLIKDDDPDVVFTWPVFPQKFQPVEL